MPIQRKEIKDVHIDLEDGVGVEKLERRQIFEIERCVHRLIQTVRLRHHHHDGGRISRIPHAGRGGGGRQGHNDQRRHQFHSDHRR